MKRFTFGLLALFTLLAFGCEPTDDRQSVVESLNPHGVQVGETYTTEVGEDNPFEPAILWKFRVLEVRGAYARCLTTWGTVGQKQQTDTTTEALRYFNQFTKQ